ncbi:MAG: hypothetical protein KDD54_02320 [Flavobacteriales bacterium]|nr:hypothetical protein [Flavobacteriales bacterium]
MTQPLNIAALLLVFILKQGCQHASDKTDSQDTTSKTDQRTVVEKRTQAFGESTLQWERMDDHSVAWNDAALKASAEWKKDTVEQNSTARNALAKALDEDPSFVKGLSKSEVRFFLGKPDQEGARWRYRYDQHFTPDQNYMGCWMEIYFSEEGTVADISRLCP